MRHESEIDGDSVATDYVLEISGAISSRDVPAFFQMDEIIGQAGFHGAGGVVSLGDQGRELNLTGIDATIQGTSWGFEGQVNRKAVAVDLRQIYQAPTADQAAVALNAFEAAWGREIRLCSTCLATSPGRK